MLERIKSNYNQYCAEWLAGFIAVGIIVYLLVR